MIVAEQKPLKEIIAMVSPFKKLLIVGCNECVTVCHAGGRKEVEQLAAALSIAAQKDGRSLEIKEVTLERCCDPEYIEQVRPYIDQYEAVLSCACSVGTQYFADTYPTTWALPALNTSFMGGSLAQGIWAERCAGCGNCIIGETGGICPIARCSKRMLNGPCGGSTGGRCEVNPDIPCGWQLIWDRLVALGRTPDYKRVMPPKDWNTSRDGGPRKIVREDLTI